MSVRELFVPEGLVGERLDAAVARITGLSRSRCATLIDDGHVQIDGETAMKSARLAPGVWLRVEIPEVVPQSAMPAATREEPEPEVPVAVIYRDDDIIVIDKPVGMAAHSSPGWSGPTVTGWLARQGLMRASMGADDREGIVQRLDVGTSGVMVVARTPAAYSHLKRQFKSRTVGKVYHTIVQGFPDPASGTIDAPIDRHPGADYRFAVISSGRPSVTHYDTLEVFRFATLLEIHLETGRTHQIRVHMSAIRHPCVGDTTYGSDPMLAGRLGLARQWLHAVRLEITHPTTGQPQIFESPYPADLQHALNLLREWTNG
jgi:23S rRNA pseudouridine1911/1915/1917 synthase